MYKTIKKTLEELDALAPDGSYGRVYAVNELVSELDAPFAIVDCRSAVREKSLRGETLWTDEEFEIGFEDASVEVCIQMAEDAAEALESLENTVTDDGKRIIMVLCSQTEPDAMDAATELMRRPLHVEMRWYKD